MGISIPPRGDSDRKIGANFAPLSVAPQDEPNMTAKIRQGSFWTALGEYIEFAGGNTVAFTIPSAGNARWDLITIDTNSVVNVTEGTEGVAPQLPPVPDNELQLAAVFMRDNTVSVKADMIFDVRPLFVAKHETLADLSTQLGLKADLSYVDNNLDTKADIGGTPEANFILNQDLTGSGATNAAFVVERGSLANVEIRWNEALTQWELSNDGTTYLPIETASIAWGDILGTLSAQTDLQAALDLKSDTTHTHLKADITDFNDADYATAAQGALADTALQVAPVTSVNALTGVVVLTTTEVAEGVNKYYTEAKVSANTNVAANTAHAADATIHFTQASISIAASQISDGATAFATFAQGATADTALQPADILVVPATANDFAALDALGNIVDGGVQASDFATAAQGTLAGTALQDITAESIGSLSDVTLATPIALHAIMHDGTDFKNRLLVEADISDLGAYLTTEVNDLTVAVTWANVPDVNITETSVTQHEAAMAVSLAQQTALDLKADLASPVFTGLPILPQTAKGGLFLGVGLAAVPVGSTTFVTDDAGASAFILAYVDATVTWIRSDNLTAIS